MCVRLCLRVCVMDWQLNVLLSGIRSCMRLWLMWRLVHGKAAVQPGDGIIGLRCIESKHIRCAYVPASYLPLSDVRPLSRRRCAKPPYVCSMFWHQLLVYLICVVLHANQCLFILSDYCFQLCLITYGSAGVESRYGTIGTGFIVSRRIRCRNELGARSCPACFVSQLFDLALRMCRARM